MNDFELDAMLRMPLPERADAGFSRGVMLRELDRRLRRERWESVGTGGVIMAGLALLAATDVGRVVAQAAGQLVSSPTFEVGLVAVVLSLGLMRLAET
ncbi:MAG TPA: hypothetical protein VGF97_05160 [Rhizomicrobium sp.]